MKNHRKIVYLLLCMAFLGNSCRSGQQSETQFVDKAQQLLTLNDEGIIPDTAIDQFFDWIRENPQSLDSQLTNSNHKIESMEIATSPDGNMRTYSIELYGFGGIPSYGFETRTLLQYRANDSIVCLELDSIQGYVYQIIRIEPSKSLYMLADCEEFNTQGTHVYMNLWGLQITDQGTIAPAPIFKKETHLLTNLDWKWDEYGYNDETDQIIFSAELSEPYEIAYDTVSNELHLPYIVTHGEYSIATEAHRVYRWNGKYFVDKGVAPLFDLHSDDFHIIIDIQANGNYRYRCWNKGRKIDDKPDLQIENGIRKCWDQDGEVFDYNAFCENFQAKSAGKIYLFYNQGFRYEYHMGDIQGKVVNKLCIYNPQNNLIYEQSYD